MYFFVWETYLKDVFPYFRFAILSKFSRGHEWLNELGSWITNNSYMPITNTSWVRARICKLQKGCTRLAAASDEVYQLLAHGRWFSPGTLASSVTKTGRHDIAEILLKVAFNTKNQSINRSFQNNYLANTYCLPNLSNALWSES